MNKGDFEHESSRLYLKDIRTFYGIRQAAN